VSFFYRAAYLIGFKPWDTGISPPELVAVIEGKDKLQPGKYLDLGCGTGTNCIYAAQHGWDATGIDFTPRAVAMAQRKVAASGAKIRVLRGDVTRLGELGIGTGYDLLFDLGCFHGLPDDGRDAYVRSISQVAKPGATYLVFCFVRREGRRAIGPPGVAPDEVATRLGQDWQLVEEQAGQPMRGFNAAWYRFHKR
jgi:cyclopropane fatty-acyl-phospholipid synthase-like methyltransferase